MGKNGVAVIRRLIGAAGVPALTVEDQHAAGFAGWLEDVLDVKADRRSVVSASVRAGYDARAADLGVEVD